MRNACLVGTFCLLASVGVLPAQETPMQPEGRIHLDVVVTDAAGRPVIGLHEQDFKLLDDGKERGLISFAPYDGLHTKADPPVQMILVIDCVNNGFVELGYIRQGLTKFLRQNNGHLTQPTTIVRFAMSGVDFLSQPSTDGNALANIVDQIGASTMPKGLDDFSLSMKAMSTLVNKMANQAGRKMLVWLGTGWPTPPVPGQVFTKADEQDRHAEYDLIVQFAKGMQEGRITLYGGYSGAEFYLRDYLKPVRKVSETDPRDLVLSALAVKSGGRGELTENNGDAAVSDALNDFVAEASTFYSLSFDPPRARNADEFHELKVEVDRPGLKVHAMTGYYDEPGYFRPKAKGGRLVIAQDSTREKQEALRPVSVVQLIQIVGEVKGKRDGEAAPEIERLKLTERLNSRKLAALSAELPGAKSKAALMAIGDASVFLEPPPDEIPQKATPDMEAQGQMVSRVVDYLKTIIPKLPNFYARRFTTSFEDVWMPKDDKRRHQRDALHRVGEFKATVYFRGGKEVVRADGAQEHGLVTLGTFGPILSTVIIDTAHSNTLHWSRWEEGPNGTMAVFQFQVPQSQSHYSISGGEVLGVTGPSAYHGEIGIDPNSGTILRLVLEADPSLGSATQRADVMVEYGSVAIGGRVYTCPVRSVSYGVGSSISLEAALGMGFDQEAARLNDVVFNDYHVFRTEMRIVP
ncbi:MAG TPA: VWA domain-containing protein [Terracidiphilus sp.]|jgi:VWFA-related protein